ncbi:fungal hydrophobin-domain-containing protein [Halenospora varia]|nr:fungal hydrophobin-domain-containing protein [Halenospora varia]
MQFSTVLITLFASLAAASPLQERQASLCTSAIDTALCCELDVDGLLDVTCSPPSPRPASVEEFQATCAAAGKGAKCCTLPVLGEALLCTNA